MERQVEAEIGPTQAGLLLGVSGKTVKRRAKLGLLPAGRVINERGDRRWPVSVIERYREQLAKESEDFRSTPPDVTPADEPTSALTPP